MFRVLFVLSSLIALLACGGNVFKSVEKEDPDQDAIKAMEDQDPDKAIRILTDALGSDIEQIINDSSASTLSQNLRAAIGDDEDKARRLSLLSAAYAQKYGLDPLSVALKMAESSGGGDGNGITALFPVLPEATAENIAGIDKALGILQAIPAERFTKADFYKQSILFSASMALRSKALDADGDGTISASEIISMTANDATTILSQLSGAAEAMGGADLNSESIAAVADQIDSLEAAIASQEGATQEEKLKNYLASTGQSSPTPSP